MKKIILSVILLCTLLYPLRAQDFFFTARNRGIQQGLPPYTPKALYADTEGRIWIGTENGLFVVEGEKARPLYWQGEPFGAYITAIIPQGHKKLWIGTQDGLYTYRYGDAGLQRIPLRNSNGSIISAYFQPLGLDPEGCLWVYTGYNRASLYRYNPGSRHIQLMGSGYNGFREINWQNGRQELWYAENRGIFRLRFGHDTVLQQGFFRDEGQALEISDVLIAGNTTWFASSDGVWQSIADAKPEPLFAKQQHIQHLAHWQNYLFAATAGNGIIVWDITRGRELHRFTHVSENPYTLSDNNIRLLYVQNDVLYYAGSNGYTGSISLRHNPAGILPLPDLLPAGAFASLHNKLWFLDVSGRLYHFPYPGLPVAVPGSPQGLQCITRIGDTLWAAGNDILYGSDGHTSVQYPLPPQAYRTRIYSITADPAGRPMLVSDHGVYLLKNRRIETLKGLENESYKHYTHAVFDRQGRLYLHAHYSFFISGSYDNGSFRNQHLHNFQSEIKTLLPHPYAPGILAVTPAGIFHCISDTDSIQTLYRFHNSSPLWYAFTEGPSLMLQTQDRLLCIPDIRTAALQQPVFLPAAAQKAGMAVRIPLSSKWLLPDLQSFWLLSPDERKPLAHIHISENGSGVYRKIQKIKQERNRNFIHLHAGIQSSVPASDLRLDYYLNNDIANTRSIPGDAGEIYFERLQPGRYKLHIKARLYDNYTIASETITLEIQPAWYNTWYFTLFWLLSTGILAAFILRAIIHSIRKREQLRRHIQETENLALRSQMNPHFIFNTLNSINSLVLDHKTEEASQYIRKFSRLIRNTLDLTRKESVSLHDDIQNLELYIQLEAERTAGRFSWQIHIDPELDTGSVSVPPLLVQPFAENAIWHGLMNRSQGGHLDIRYKCLDKDTLCIYIDDNGIGYTEGHKRSASRIHTSHGLSIIKERLQLAGTANFFRIADKNSGDEKGSGTRAEIYLNVKC